MQQWLVSQIETLSKKFRVELDRLKQQKDKLEREQRKLLQAHYADAIPLHLLREEQERINKSLSAIKSQMEAYRADYEEVVQNMNLTFELLDDCGRAYKLAGDFERRCFNQAIFKRILVHEDLTLQVEYNEPFNIILDSKVFILKSHFEKMLPNSNDGQRNCAGHHTIVDILNSIKLKPSVKNFFSDGLSKDLMVRITGLEPAQPCDY